MIPPTPAINDAIGLLAAISDPAKAQALLVEMRDYVDTANGALRQAQEVAVAGQRAVEDQRAMSDKNGKDRLAFEEEKNRREAEWATQSQGVANVQRALAEKEKNLKLLEDKIDADMAAVADRERAVVHDRAVMDAREKALAEREFKLAETLKELGPIAQKLGLDK